MIRFISAVSGHCSSVSGGYDEYEDLADAVTLALLALVVSAQAGWLGVGGAQGTPPRIETAELAPGPHGDLHRSWPGSRPIR